MFGYIKFIARYFWRLLLLPFRLLIRLFKWWWRLSFFKKIVVLFVSFLFSIIVILSLIISVSWIVDQKSEGNIYTQVDHLPEKQVALVLGALVYSDGHLSDMFADRVQTGLELYQAGRVKKILVSGDHGRKGYDEVNAAKKNLLDAGVREEDIFLDHAGFDTYDSLYRARDVFQAESLIIVSQEFHLPRAVYIAQSLGIDAVGMKADKQDYAGTQRNELREYFARVKAVKDVLFQVGPKFGGEVIPLSGDGRGSWD